MFPRCLLASAPSPTLGSLQVSRARGPAVLAVHYLALRWWHNLRARHAWLSVLAPSADPALLLLPRPQRVAVLCVATLCGLAFNALFFGSQPETVAQTITLGLLSAVVMAPVQVRVYVPSGFSCCSFLPDVLVPG